MTSGSYSEDQPVESSSCYLSSSDDEADSQKLTTLSILDKLKRPTTSDLHRKRKTKSNPLRSNKRNSGSSYSDLKSVTHGHRVKEYPKEPFKVSNHKLFCYGCREELNLKRTTIANHARSNKIYMYREKGTPMIALWCPAFSNHG